MLGLSDVPAIRLDHLDEAECRACHIADDKLTELGEWDEAILREEIAVLLAEGEDDNPEPLVTPASVAGDLLQMGSHRLICGDGTSADVVRRLLGDVRPLPMRTDPPYGVEYDPSWRNQAGAAKTKRTGMVLNDDRADWRGAWALFPGDVAYV